MHLFFATSAEDVLTALESNSTVGLTEAQVAASRGRYGANELSRPPSISMMRRIMDALREPMLLLLLLAGVITLTVNLVRLFSGHETDFVECVGIFVAILLSIGISVIMEGRSAKAFDALRKMGNDVRVKILRNGDVLHLPQNELVVGDIVYVGTGDKIVADGRLLE
ncbi:MAG: cation-transporting P-type ATPase, partial [Kiritimatiellia bacterium]